MTNHRRTRAELLDASYEFGATDRDQGVAVVSGRFLPFGSRAQDFDRQAREMVVEPGSQGTEDDRKANKLVAASL
jgi:hypothetical protein